MNSRWKLLNVLVAMVATAFHRIPPHGAMADIYVYVPVDIMGNAVSSILMNVKQGPV